MSADDTPPWVDPRWLLMVPELIERCARRWRLSIGPRLGRGNTSRVFGCVDDQGRHVVLKLTPAETRPDLEAAALRAWDGHGAARLIDFAPDANALLLERVVPGTPLPSVDDEAATELAARPLMALHAARLGTADLFPTQLEFLDLWIDRVKRSGERGTAGLRLLDRARDAARALCADRTAVVLLHGDFIDKNLMLAEDGYVAIDPIPRLGDPCSDVGFYAAYHPPAGAIGHRARSLATRCRLDPERAARWATVWAVGEASETWRPDSDALQAWIEGREAASLLRPHR
jgi:streptomycin 6-kinase